MIKQGHEWTGDATESCEVLIIGSGCGGSTVAKALSEQGHSVVVLDKGGYYTAADLDQREANMVAKLDGGRGVDSTDDGGVQLTYGNNVGGASMHYWADSYRTPADRLQLWEEEYGMQGHDLATLTPHFERIERDLHVHPAPNALVNRMNELVRDGARQLGWRVERVPQARKGCVKSGHCMQGCAYDAKQSQLVTHLAAARANGARIYSDVQASRLVFDGRDVSTVAAIVLDRATGRPRGPKLTFRPKAVVVAAGGYGTPLFLLRQRLKARLPSLGEHLFVNPCPMVHARFDEDIVQWRNIPASWGVEEFRLARYQGDAYVEGGYLLMANQLHPGMLAAALPGVGAKHRALMRDLPRLGGTISWVDDVERGRVTLERHGVRFHVRLSGNNELRIRDAWRKQAQLLLAAGAREVIFGDLADTRITAAAEIDRAVAGIDLRPARNVLAAPHPGGAAKMGEDPYASVVGFDHRVHGTDNLFVADPSVFPSPPSVDPSVTIMAFSYVAAGFVGQML